MGKNNNYLMSEMYCTKCGKKGLDVARKPSRLREPGHLKKLYCVYCGQEQNHVEIREMYSDYNLEDFKLEMQYKNFDEEGNRKEPYRIFRGKLKQKRNNINVKY